MPPSPQASDPNTDALTAAATRNREVTEKLRTRADTAAKTFGTLATSAVTAIGFSKFGDIYPWQEGLYWPIAGIIAGFVVMVGVVAFFTARLWGVT